jgi:hypothetical protein
MVVLENPRTMGNGRRKGDLRTVRGDGICRGTLEGIKARRFVTTSR